MKPEKPKEEIIETSKGKDLTSDFIIYGVIIKGSLDEIRELKSFLEKNNFKIHYQRYSSNFLKIIDANEEG